MQRGRVRTGARQLSASCDLRRSTAHQACPHAWTAGPDRPILTRDCSLDPSYEAGGIGTRQANSARPRRQAAPCTLKATAGAEQRHAAGVYGTDDRASCAAPQDNAAEAAYRPLRTRAHPLLLLLLSLFSPSSRGGTDGRCIAYRSLQSAVKNINSPLCPRIYLSQSIPRHLCAVVLRGHLSADYAHSGTSNARWEQNVNHSRVAR